MTYLISAVASFFIALFVTTLGIGGSFLYIPLFAWLGFNYKLTAIPTVLLLNTLASFMGQGPYLRKGLTDVKVAAIMSVAGGIFAQFGTYIGRFISAETLMIIFALVIIAAALQILFFNNHEVKKQKRYTMNFAIAFLVGGVAGTLSGLLGIGGGLVLVPALMYAGYPIKKAAATSLLVIFFASASGFLAHLQYSMLDLNLAATSGIAVIVGSNIGARLMTEKIHSATLKRVFGIIMLLVAIKILIDRI